MFHKRLWHIVSLITITHSFYTSPPVAPENILDCGSTPTEAKSKGCHFDMFSYAWYRQQCFNEVHHNKFLDLHAHEIDWRLPDYSPITTEEVLEGTHIDLRPITGQFHDLHCTYEWGRLFGALAKKRLLDTKLSRNVRSYHCSLLSLLREVTEKGQNCSQRNQGHDSKYAFWTLWIDAE